MKFIKQLLAEMPIHGGQLRDQADLFAASFKEKFKPEQFKHIADLDSFEVQSNGSYFVLLNESEIIFICHVDSVPNYGHIIDNVWVDKSYSNKKLFSKMLWFFFSRMKKQPLYFASVHSTETMNALKAGGFSKFKKTWVNDFLNKEMPFDPESIEQYYASTKWKLKLELSESLTEILEEVQDSFFRTESFSRVAYDWQLAYI
jgi:hypothetical protein